MKKFYTYIYKTNAFVVGAMRHRSPTPDYQCVRSRVDNSIQHNGFLYSYSQQFLPQRAHISLIRRYFFPSTRILIYSYTIAHYFLKVTVLLTRNYYKTSGKISAPTALLQKCSLQSLQLTCQYPSPRILLLWILRQETGNQY